MTQEQVRFIKGCSILLALGTSPVLFMNFSGYIAGLIFIALLTLILAHILF